MSIATELSTCSAVCNTNKDVNRYIDFSESSAWSLNDLLFSTSFCLQFNCTFTQSETLRVAEWSVDVCFLFNFAYFCFFFVYVILFISVYDWTSSHLCITWFDDSNTLLHDLNRLNISLFEMLRNNFNDTKSLLYMSRQIQLWFNPTYLIANKTKIQYESTPAGFV